MNSPLDALQRFLEEVDNNPVPEEETIEHSEESQKMAVEYLLLNAEVNREKYLEADVKRLAKESGFKLEPSETMGVKPLERLLELYFPEGLGQEVWISNTSNRENKYYLSVRVIAKSPRLEEIVPQGMSVCFQGFVDTRRSGRVILTLNRILPISESQPRSFERKLNVVSIHSENNVPEVPGGQPLVYALNGNFLRSLPAISQETRQKLRDWLGYLDWKEAIVRKKLVGVRYLERTVTEDGAVRFLIAGPSRQAIQQTLRGGGRDGLLVFPVSYSTDEWEFMSNDKFRGRGRGLGEVPGKPTFFEESKLKGLKNLPWKSPVVAALEFPLDETTQERWEASKDDEEVLATFREELEEGLPGEGWLATSAVGDLALIRRQHRSLRDFQEQGGFAPFLSSYLFDIREARLPEEMVEVTEWLRDNLNEDQKRAVQVMLSVPDIGLVQGPPGTGKTTVIAEAAYQFVRRGLRVLLVSQANLAVDNALERLANNPHIRAIRLGKPGKISEDLPFHEDNVVGWFYQNIAASVRAHKLEVWEHTKEMQRRTELWQERIDLLTEDIRQSQASLQEIKQEEQSLQRERKEEERKEKQARATQEQLEDLQGFFDLLEGKEWLRPWLPLTVLESFENNVVKPLRSLEQVGLALLGEWDDVMEAPEARRALEVGRILQRWNQLAKLWPELSRELKRLQSQVGDTCLSPEQEQELQELAIEKQKVLEKLEEDEAELENYRTIAARERALRKQGSRPNLQKFSSLFEGDFLIQGTSHAVTPSALTRGEAVKLLERLERNLMQLSPKIRHGLQDLEAQVHGSLEALQLQASYDPGALRRLDGMKRLFQKKKRELLERLQQKHASVQKLLDELPIPTKKAIRLRTRLTECGKEKRVTQGLSSPLSSKLGAKGLGGVSSILPVVGKKNSSQLAVMQQVLAECAREWQQRWEDQKALQDLLKPLVKDWVEQLEDPAKAEQDKALLKSDYIAGCNVVGVTCTERNDTLIEAGQPYFDVVIIDEVSKATPCEMMMSLMLARKAILIGDHRQLPPLFKERADASWKEALEEAKEQGLEVGLLSPENFQRYEKMVTASLFKEHFENADPSLKSTLWTQYRMHPQIMEVINHFYEGRLACGLQDPDGFDTPKNPGGHRVHGLTLHGNDRVELLTPDRHVLWLDSSKDARNNPFYEEQSGTSKVNELEALMIARLLGQLNEALLEQGYGKTRQKEVGVISFYGRQIGAIRRAIERYKRLHATNLEALHVRISTVDRFQGQEKAIVLVSLVRNTKRKRAGANSHVAAFERINVAFSRAQELLVVLGAKDMFHNIPVSMPNLDRPGSSEQDIYRRILGLIDREGGLHPSTALLSPAAQARLMPPLSTTKERNLRGSSQPRSRTNPPAMSWEETSQRFTPGSVHRGTITKVVQYGLFVCLEDGPTSLLHSSKRLSPSKIRAEQKGDGVVVEVMGQNPAKQQLELREIQSMKPKDSKLQPKSTEELES